jgi:hypothetical protein
LVIFIISISYIESKHLAGVIIERQAKIDEGCMQNKVYVFGGYLKLLAYILVERISLTDQVYVGDITHLLLMSR